MPVAERSEPQVPLEARLVGSVNAWSFVERLRLVTEKIGRPVLPVVRALEFDFITAASHHGKQTILVGDAKWLQCQNRGGWKRQIGPGHSNHLRRGCIGNPGEHESRYENACRIEITGRAANCWRSLRR